MYRGTIYHSPLARTRNFFNSYDDFCSAVRGLNLKEFVIDDCYGGRAQITRSQNWKEHAKILWATVQNSAANWWLLGTPKPGPPPKGGKRAPAVPKKPVAPKRTQAPPKSKRKVGAGKGKGKRRVESDTEPDDEPAPAVPKPAPAVLPTYKEVLTVVTDKKLKFPLCGDLAGHLLAADYADAGLCQQPDEHVMAHGICKIDAGAVAGLQALDYFHAGALHYQKQRAFVQLYQFLDGELTADEKQRLHWNPICLEHALCKYLRFITNFHFFTLFQSSYYTQTQFAGSG
ncbi:hypothetical protein C8R47DRAFT_1223743 [Mycena vitilis]|nr:hypothetical protein C8R47DRAFT_1223743 [Mycena vitilis]